MSSMSSTTSLGRFLWRMRHFIHWDLQPELSKCISSLSVEINVDVARLAVDVGRVGAIIDVVPDGHGGGDVVVGTFISDLVGVEVVRALMGASSDCFVYFFSLFYGLSVNSSYMSVPTLTLTPSSS